MQNEAAVKNEAGGDDKHVFFLLGLSLCKRIKIFQKVKTFLTR